MTKKKVMPVPRGVRNNNPLNIRYVHSNDWEGKILFGKKDQVFEEFFHMRWGYRAAFMLLRTHWSRGVNTMAKLIEVWAPRDENLTDWYIMNVEDISGIDRHREFELYTGIDFIQLLCAMTVVECGKGYPTKEMIRNCCEAWEMVCHSLKDRRCKDNE